MIGAGALIECLADPRVESVVAATRRTTGVLHPKLREIIHADFYRYDALSADFTSCDACFFCLGVTSVGLDEATYTHLTFDLTLAAARAMVAANPAMTFCYVSGLGTDSMAKGRTMWTRVKGRTENAILALGFRDAYMFRPGYIQPVKGARLSTAWYQAVYSVFGVLYPVLRVVFPSYVTTTENLGRALIQVAAAGSPTKVLEPTEINKLAAA